MCSTEPSDEAQNHAVRAKNYLMNVRHIPWNRIIWRDIGYADDFRVIIWIVPNGHDAAFEYNPATPQHVVRDCRRRRR
jgi:hypothetical protein